MTIVHKMFLKKDCSKIVAYNGTHGNVCGNFLLFLKLMVRVMDLLIPYLLSKHM